ncbi:MAG: cytochrome c-type biogenesis protein, partial [Gammaproteobacteria bacterium]|nr:cytochrome c-type biogenesis protein [Gammaproteobacteria bacterium]
PEHRHRYYALIEEIRCLVCQNQNLADSNADLAQDLRDTILSQINEGKSNDEIMDFLTARYGDFVLYRPPLKPTTIRLWVGPFIILLVALAVLVQSIRTRKSSVSDRDTNPDSEKQIARLLGNDGSRDRQ